MGRARSSIGDKRKSHTILVKKGERKGPLARSRRRRENNIITDLKGTGWEDASWLNLEHDRRKWQAVVIIVMDLRVPQNTSSFSDYDFLIS
jgi:hypothetical protein